MLSFFIFGNKVILNKVILNKDIHSVTDVLKQRGIIPEVNKMVLAIDPFGHAKEEEEITPLDKVQNTTYTVHLQCF